MFDEYDTTCKYDRDNKEACDFVAAYYGYNGIISKYVKCI